jgi:serine/threonine-protein kinase/endoribonuclease IRE1
MLWKNGMITQFTPPSGGSFPVKVKVCFFCSSMVELLMHNNVFAFQKLKVSPEEYIRNAPYVSEDGGVTLGSKKTTVFLVDTKSGKVVHTYKLDDSPSTSRVQGVEENPVLLNEDAEEFVESDLNLETVEQPLYIKRIDYVLQHYSPDNGKVLWNVAFAEFDAAFWYPKIESSFGGIYQKSSNDLGQQHGGDDNSQLLYQSGPIVIRNRDHRLTESLSVFDRLINGHSGGRPLPLPAPSHNFSSGAADQLLLAPPNNEGGQMLSLPAPKNETSGILVVQDGDASEMKVASIFAKIMAKFHIRSLISFLLALLSIMGFVFYRHRAFAEKLKLNRHEDELKLQAGAPKRKRSRRLGNNKKSANKQEMPKDNAHENNDGKTKGDPNVEGSEWKPLVTFTDLVDTHLDGRRIGKLLVSYKEIAKGSNGTIVLEGVYDGRPAAVKRLVRAHHDVALKEIQNLIASDHHLNIVRWYGVEYDQDFVYLSLERCICSLNDLICICSEFFQSQRTKDQDSNFSNEYTVRLQSIKEINKDVELWKKNGHPTPQLLKLMRLV